MVGKSLVRITFTGVLIFNFVFQALGQNLVPNPSFEEYKELQCARSSNAVDFNNTTVSWISPTTGTPDLFSLLVDRSCGNHPFSTAQGAVGQQEPKDGDFMVGLLTYNERNTGVCFDFSEYIQVELAEPLVKGQNYLGGFYISLGEKRDIATNNMGMHISETPLNADTCVYFNVRPQFNVESIITDSVGWVFVNGSFEADNNGRYLTIGNFFSDEETARIFFNDNPFLSIRINYYFLDSIFLEPINELNIPNVFTPNEDGYNETFFIKELQEDRWILTITNRWGQKVYESKYYRNEWDGEGLATGVYYYLLEHRYADIEYKGDVTILL